jgi:hypothetical protein
MWLSRLLAAAQWTLDVLSMQAAPRFYGNGGSMNYDALCFGLAFVVAFLFFLAWLGMSAGPHRTAGLPPDHPPGWKNEKTEGA